jgi:phosphoribosylglycinamide formyltransferase 1
VKPRKRVGILISGRGSNMLSLIEAARAPDYPAEIAIVISNRPEAPGLERARAAGISAIVIDHRQFPSRAPFEMKLHGALKDQRVDLVCNAGFMRMLTGAFVDRWRDRHLNIHPSLLPAFPGLNVHQRVLEGGVMITGCTVHFVRVAMDAGPIIAQAAVPVLPDDSPELLAARVLKVEHRLYPHAVRLVASGAARIVHEKVALDPISYDAPNLIWPPLESG